MGGGGGWGGIGGMGGGGWGGVGGVGGVGGSAWSGVSSVSGVGGSNRRSVGRRSNIVNDNVISFMNRPSPSSRASIDTKSRDVQSEPRKGVFEDKPKDSVQVLKDTVKDLASFVRDYPTIQTKLWSSRKKSDSRLAASMFKKSAELLSVIGTSQPPLGQILSPRGANVVGFIGSDGRVVSAPFMNILENIPIVASNNASNYRDLVRNSIDFTHQMVNVHSRFKKNK